MTLWLLGSKAAQIHSLPFERTIRDEFDLIGTEEDLVRLGATHLRDNVYTLDRAGQTYTLTFDHTSPSNQLLMQQTPADVYSFFEFQFNVPSKGILYETKRSHANYNYRFDETLDDLIVMKRSGWHEEAEFGEYYTQRRNEAKELYPHPERKRVDISKVSHEKLFAEQKTKPVRHDFWHDDIHEATCRYESPLYTKCKYNQSSPLLDRGLTEQLSLEDQIILAQEECLVLYLESSYINTFLDKKMCPSTIPRTVSTTGSLMSSPSIKTV